MSGQNRASSARKSRKSTVIPAIQQRRTPRRFGCDQRDQLRRERIQELWSAIDSRIKEFQVSSFASSSYSSDESGQVQTLVKSAVRRCPRMSRDKRGNRTQEVDGSSPFSSTTSFNQLAEIWARKLPQGAHKSFGGGCRTSTGIVLLEEESHAEHDCRSHAKNHKRINV